MSDIDVGAASRIRDPRDVLHAAGRRAGLSTADAQLIRDGANVLYRLPGAIVARVGPPGSRVVAERQIVASRWLADAGIPVVRVLDDVEQPILVGDQPVTWWEQLPEHRHANPAELGEVLSRLHVLPMPDEPLFPAVDPFDGLNETIDSTGAALPEEERTWLRRLLKRLRTEYAELKPGQPLCVVHGDAWQGNVVVPEGGNPTLLDLDHVGIGLREWDLVSMAVEYTDFARITPSDYRAFVGAYGGYDMTTWPGYRTLATIRELRWTAFVLSKADTDPKAAQQARHRVACLQGDLDQPWSWSAF